MQTHLHQRAAMCDLGKVPPATARRHSTLLPRSIKTCAFFKKAAPVVEAPPPPPPKFGGLFGGGTKKQESAPEAKGVKKTTSKAEEYERRRGIGGVIAAFDFSEARSQRDAELLYDARYGKRQNGKMSPEQAAALRRKVGGTAKDFWKTSIDVVGEYTDKGYVDTSSSSAQVPALPFLVITVLALFGTVGYVVSQTTQ